MKNKVFELQPHCDHFQVLALKYGDDWDDLLEMFDGKPILSKWKPYEVEVIRERKKDWKLPAGDFPSLSSGMPIFSARAVQKLKPWLDKKFGELLPLKCKEGDYFAFNITLIVDALDMDRSKISRFDSGRIMNVAEYVLKASKIKNGTIFKLKHDEKSDPFVTEDFVETVKKEGLTGFDFKEVKLV